MKITPAARLVPLAIFALALSGCAAVAPAGGGTPGPDGDPGSSQNSGGGGGGSSFATVTVDGTTWDYSSFMCVVGYEETASDTYSFSSTSFTTADGEKIQFLIDVNDSSGQNRLEGNGVKYEITLFDYANPENPSVEFKLSGTQGVTINGKAVTVSGEFSGFDGEAHTVQAEALCQ